MELGGEGKTYYGNNAAGERSFLRIQYIYIESQNLLNANIAPKLAYTS